MYPEIVYPLFRKPHLIHALTLHIHHHRDFHSLNDEHSDVLILPIHYSLHGLHHLLVVLLHPLRR